MAVRKFKPVTPGQRHKIIGVFRNEIAIAKPAEGAEKVKKVSKITPEKSLVVGKRSTAAATHRVIFQPVTVVWPQEKIASH